MNHILKSSPRYPVTSRGAGFIFVYITNPSKKVAHTVARHLLKKRLIACANIFPMESMYWWKGKLAQEKEWVLIAKTIEKKYAEVTQTVSVIHPYTVPCVIKINVEANKTYGAWLVGQIKK